MKSFMTLVCDLKGKKVVFATRQIQLLIKIFPLVRSEYIAQSHPQASVAQIYSQTSQTESSHLSSYIVSPGVDKNFVRHIPCVWIF